jgi:DNA polymerase-3 subunit beta
MRFVCNRQKLKEKLDLVSKVIPARSTKESLSSILIRTEPPDRLYLYGTNIETSIDISIECETEQDDEFLISAKLFKEIIDNLDSDIIIGDIEDKLLNITAGTTFYSIPTQDMADFPIIEEISPEKELSLDISILKGAIRKVIPFVDKSNYRPVLAGIFLDLREDGIRFVSTDANRLAVKKLSRQVLKFLNEGFDISVILPTLSLDTIMGIQSEGNITIEFSGPRVRFKADNLKLTTSTIEGTFPKYEAVIPSKFVTKLTLDKDILKNSIKRILPVSREEDYATKFSVKKDKLMVSARSPIGIVEDEIPAHTDGDEIDIIFSAKYILDFLAVGNGPVNIELSGNLSPALFTFTNDPDFMHIAMPIEEE